MNARKFKRQRSGVSAEETLKNTTNDSKEQLKEMQQLIQDQDKKIGFTVMTMLLKKTATRMAGSDDAVSCPDGCQHCCESTEGYTYGFSDALITTIQNYSLLLKMYQNGQFSVSSKRCPLLSLDGRCMIQDNKPYMCTTYLPVKTKDGRISCMYRDAALQEGCDFSGTRMEVSFNVASSFAEDIVSVQTVFPSKLTERRFSSIAEGSRWMIQNLPSLMSEKTFYAMVHLAQHSEGVVGELKNDGIR